MKKTTLLFLGILMSAMSAMYAGTYTPPQYEDTVSGVWKTGSTIRLFNSILIPPGKSLTIEPGVTVLICDTGTVTSRNQSGNKIEIDVLGDFYCLGTAAQPNLIKVNDSLLNPNSYGPYGQYWGSIFTDTSCHEFVFLYTDMSNTGYVTTSTSYSVQLGLFKAAAGETTPEICYRGGMGVNGGTTPHGKLVVEHNTFHNTSDDCVYVQGGNILIAYNTVYTEGETGGDCFDIKSGSWGDICYNLIYNPNTNGVKLANTGGFNPTIDINAYNNTIVKAGWRRPSVKGGSMWIESAAIGFFYDNLILDCRYGLKNNASSGGADTSSRWDYQYYFNHSQLGIDQEQPLADGGPTDVVAGPHDVRDSSLKANSRIDPLFVNYTPGDSSVAVGTQGFWLDSTYNTKYDFHLRKGSPAIGKGTTKVPSFWNVTPITFTEHNPASYNSPAANATPGAFGVLGIQISPKPVTLANGKTVTLTATTTPDTLSYTWSTSNSAVATVNASGLVTALKTGTTKIYAISKSQNLVYDSCMVSVFTPVTAINLNPLTLTLKVDSIKPLNATVTPTYADTISVTWNSSKTSVATVDANGNVKGVSPGTAYIRVISNSNNSIKDSSMVTVINSTAILTAEGNVSNLSVYPNPANTDLNIKFNATEERSTISVYSLVGQAIISTSVSNSTGEVTHTLSVDGLAKGLYIIRVQNGDQTLTQKFIKQ